MNLFNGKTCTNYTNSHYRKNGIDKYIELMIHSRLLNTSKIISNYFVIYHNGTNDYKHGFVLIEINKDENHST
jgi:hypothetical protein